MYRRNGKPVKGIAIHRDELPDEEVSIVHGMPATTLARTAFDLGRRKGLKKAIIRVDALANGTGVKAVDVEDLIRRHRGARGLVQLRQVLDLMDSGADSPQETLTRLTLIGAGLPRPQTQIPVRVGMQLFRIDMGYEAYKVGVEYDGIQHWNRRERAYDIDRHAQLHSRGWRIVRVSAEILRYRPHTIVTRTCDALAAAGAEWPPIARFSQKCVS